MTDENDGATASSASGAFRGAPDGDIPRTEGGAAPRTSDGAQDDPASELVERAPVQAPERAPEQARLLMPDRTAGTALPHVAVEAPGLPTGPGAGRSDAGHGGHRAALSPSRAKDFLQCPLMFRLRTVDRLPEPGSLATHKGTLVHAVLERLFDLPARERSRQAALAMLPGQWESHRSASPEVMTLFASQEHVRPWLDEAADLIGAYFKMENPSRLEPAERELRVQTETRDGLLLRGFVDRLDVAPDGAMRVVDYKTGRSPGPRFQEDALFQMRFYGLVLWRQRGEVPRRLQLIYLKDGRTLTHDPRPAELETMETRLSRIWDDVEDCARAGRFEPHRSRLCDWCAFQAQCPLFGGVTPAIPADGVERLLTARRPARAAGA